MVSQTIFMKFIPFHLDFSRRTSPFSEDRKHGEIHEGQSHFNYWDDYVSKSRNHIYMRKPRQAINWSPLNTLCLKLIRIYTAPKNLSSGQTWPVYVKCRFYLQCPAFHLLLIISIIKIRKSQVYQWYKFQS